MEDEITAFGRDCNMPGQYPYVWVGPLQSSLQKHNVYDGIL